MFPCQRAELFPRPSVPTRVREELSMRTVLKTVFFAGLPLAGLLMTTPVVFAHDSAHREIHRDLGRMHEDFHQMPHSRGEHRQFHREMKQEHYALDRELRNSRGGYGY